MTKLETQYRDAKAAADGALCLFKMGDFYELFFEDATTAARELGLALTTRSRRDEQPIPMAGFPHHQLDAYLTKMVANGHRVALLEQVQDFTLANDPPKHTPKRFERQPNTLQKVCVDGMDCLPGQLDLF